MLKLINDARRSAGLVEVVLDDNPTAQLHAEDMRANCFLSHWGSEGNKPYVRYTLNGGLDYSAENVHGPIYCPPDSGRWGEEALSRGVVGAYEWLMGSPGHRKNILDPSHRKVGLGFSYQHPNRWVAQLFTSDHIQFVELPSIEEGVLTFGYRLTNGAGYGDYPPSASVFFDPPPHDLARGQLIRSYRCYALGQRIAGIRPSAGENSSWTEDYFETELSDCPNPYDIAPDAPVPTGYFDPIPTSEPVVAPNGEQAPPLAEWITSEVWQLDGGGYSVRSDISHLVAQYGPGVYTLVVFGDIDGRSAPVSKYSIFVQ